MLHQFAQRHPTDEDLELYALDRLDRTSVERIEEHLLVCPECRQEFLELEEWAELIRLAIDEGIHLGGRKGPMLLVYS